MKLQHDALSALDAIGVVCLHTFRHKVAGKQALGTQWKTPSCARINALAVALAILALHLLSGCSTVQGIVNIDQVKPWQRGALAREDMQAVVDPMQQSVDDHIYFSKEGSTGGSSLQGGGCGCN